MPDFNKVLTPGDIANGKVNTVVEIAKGSTMKVEWDRERTAFEGLLIEASNRLLGYAAIGIVDECETPWATGLPIDGQHDLGWYADTRQMLPQICLVCRVRQIANKQTN